MNITRGLIALYLCFGAGVGAGVVMANVMPVNWRTFTKLVLFWPATVVDYIWWEVLP